MKFQSTWIILYSVMHLMQSQPIYTGSAQFLPQLNEVSVTIDYDNDIVEITFIGQDTVWNGIGFSQHIMNGTYAIIMDYGEVDPVIHEAILGHHTSGTQILDGIIDRISDETVGNTRTVTMTRAIDSDYYSFPPNQGTPTMEIPMIAAVGISYGFFVLNIGHTATEPEQFTLTLIRTGTTTSSPLINTTSETFVCCDCVSTYLQMSPGEPCPKNTAGCSDDAQCEELICERDPYCCTKQWDKICSIQSQQVCNGNELPKCCGCTRKSKRNGRKIKDAGCVHDEFCEDEICSNDAFCCGADEKGVGYWDHVCRKQAKAICKGYGMQRMDMDNDDEMKE